MTITIPRGIVVLLILALIALVGLLFGEELPAMRRYLRIERM